MTGPVAEVLGWLPWVALALALLAALSFRGRQHRAVRILSGYVAARQGVDTYGFHPVTGDPIRVEICSCGATREIGRSRWSRVFCRQPKS